MNPIDKTATGLAPAADNAKTIEAAENRRAANQLIRELFILAALWLPLGFFLWFFYGSFLIRPVILLGNALFDRLVPEVIGRLVQNGFEVVVNTPVRLDQMVEGRFVAIDVPLNPMIYAYGVPLLFGLVMATPRLTVARRAVQILSGYLILLVVQLWGVFWEAMMQMAFFKGPQAAAAVAATGVPQSLIALSYQLGYLILPAVVPIALWILMNRRFLESIALNRAR